MLVYFHVLTHPVYYSWETPCRISSYRKHPTFKVPFQCLLHKAFIELPVVLLSTLNAFCMVKFVFALFLCLFFLPDYRFIKHKVSYKHTTQIFFPPPRWGNGSRKACLRSCSQLEVMLGMDSTHPKPAQGSFSTPIYSNEFPKSRDQDSLILWTNNEIG